MTILPRVAHNTREGSYPPRGGRFFLMAERVDTSHRGLYSNLKETSGVYPLKELRCSEPSDFQN